jgi:PAS domain-containing protein
MKSFNWLDILEAHFNKRRKAFLVFDDNDILRYISDYAKEILELDENLIGFVSLNELFPPSEKNTQLLVDQNYAYSSFHYIVYTTPSGRSKELRVNRDTSLLSINELKGYVIWVEAKSRDITAVYKKVSSLDPYKHFEWLFDQNDIGFILIDSEGVIKQMNARVKNYINEPGEWQGRNLLTFSFVHQHGIASMINKGLKNSQKPRSKDLVLKSSEKKNQYELKWSVLPLTDLEGIIIGAMITVRQV